MIGSHLKALLLLAFTIIFCSSCQNSNSSIEALDGLIAAERQLRVLQARNKLDWGDWMATTVAGVEDYLDTGGTPSDLVSLMLDESLDPPRRFSLYVGTGFYGFPDLGRPPYRLPKKDDSPEMRQWLVTMRSRQLQVSERFVRSFVERPELVRDYFQFALWSRTLLAGDNHYISLNHIANEQGAKLVQSLAAAESDAGLTWWYLRDFVLLAHLTGRDDLFAGVREQARLVENARMWHRWLQASDASSFSFAADSYTFGRNNAQMHQAGQVELPMVPFPTWSAVAPMAFHDMRAAAESSQILKHLWFGRGQSVNPSQ